MIRLRSFHQLAIQGWDQSDLPAFWLWYCNYKEISKVQGTRTQNAKPDRADIHFTRLASLSCPYKQSYTSSNDTISHSLAKMSDYEDEMDVDDAPIKESVLFNSDNTNAKGKRSAANLPIEAEDSLPW